MGGVGMPNAIERLLADHKMIRKTLEVFHRDNPRYGLIRETLHRIVLGHAWFEDEILLPALRNEPLLERRLTDEIIQEHKDIAHLLKLIQKTSPDQERQWAPLALQLRVILETHFRKEEDALFPLAERILRSEGLIELSTQMEKRKMEVHDLLNKVVT